MLTDLQEQNLLGKVRCIKYADYTEVYNKKGFMVYYHEFDAADETAEAADSEEYAEVTEYDETGKKRAAYSVNLSVDDASCFEQYTYDGNICIMQTFYGEKEKGDSEKLVFDNNHLLIERYFFDDHEQKKLLKKETYEYENGRKTRMYFFTPDEVEENRHVQRGQLYRYDERGNLSRIADLCNCCPFHDNPEDWIYFTYTNFDSRGNWLTRKRYHIIMDTEITQRRIIYWE